MRNDNELEYLDFMKLCVQEKHAEKLIFFDSQVVIPMCKGVEDFYKDDDRKELKRMAFRDEKVIIACLASAGEIDGTISLLPYHLDEFYLHFTQDFGLASRTNFTKKHLDSLIRMTNTRFPDSEKAQVQLKRSLKNFHSQFKVAISSYEASWKVRTRRIFVEKKIINLKPDGVNFRLPNNWQETYLEIYSELEERRKGKRELNRNDAHALISLLGQIEKYNQGTLSALPLFYDPQNYYADILYSIGLAGRFQLNSDYGPTPALRPSSYFLINAIFSKGAPWKRKFQEIIKNWDFSTSEYDEQKMRVMKLNEHSTWRDFPKQLLNYINYEFLNRIILQQLGVKTSLSEVYSSMNISLEKFNESEFMDKFHQDLSNLRIEIQGAVSQIQSEKEIWNAISIGGNYFRQSVVPQSKRVTDLQIEKDFGLLRFSFTRRTIENVEMLLGEKGGLLNARAQDKKLNEGAKTKIFSTLLQKQDDPNFDFELFSVGICALWIFERYDIIVRLIDARLESKHISLELIKASAIVRSSDIQDSSLDRILKGLETRLKKPNYRYKLETYLGLAYIYAYIVDPSEGFTSDNSVPMKMSENVNKCLGNAESAYELFKDLKIQDSHQGMIKMYVLNVLVHCGVEFGNAFYFKNKTIVYANQLIALGDKNKHTWQYRFDDTIARYYHRMAFENPSKRKINLAAALMSAEKAKQGPIKDDIVEKYYIHLLNIPDNK